MSKLIKTSSFECASGILRILYSKDDLIVRNSSINDWKFVDKLQKENSFAVGFIQQTIWEKYVWGGERNFSVLICEKNHDPVGYLLLTPGGKEHGLAKIQQIVVRNDARRLDYGSALIEVGKNYCEYLNVEGFSLRCRIDLESNRFWESLGFEKYGTWEKGKRNHMGMKASNTINLWKINLNSLQPLLLSNEINEKREK